MHLFSGKKEDRFLHCRIGEVHGFGMTMNLFSEKKEDLCCFTVALRGSVGRDDHALVLGEEGGKVCFTVALSLFSEKEEMLLHCSIELVLGEEGGNVASL